MTIQTILPYLTQGTIILVTLVTLADFLRHRDPARVDVLLMFGDLALIVVLQWLNQATGARYAWVGLANGILLMAHPYLLLRLVQHLRPVPLVIRLLIAGGLVVAWAGLVLLGSPLPVWGSVAMVVYFAVAELYSVGVFFQGAVTTRGVTRWRLQLAALGSGLIAVVIVLAGMYALTPRAAATLGPFQQVIGLLAVLGYFLGFAPPAWMRRVWQFNELYRYLSATPTNLNNRRTQDVLQRLCLAAEQSVGGSVALVALRRPDEDRFAIHMAGGRPGAQQPEGADLALNGPALERVWEQCRPAYLRIPADFPRLHGQTAPLRNARALFAVPLATAEQAWGVLLVFLLAAPLFAQDDLALLGLLSQQTAVTLGYWELLAEQEQRVADRTEQLAAAVKGLENEVSARKQTSDALRVAQERLRFLLYATPAMIYSVRATGDRAVTFVSENVRALLGYTAQNFTGDGDFWLSQVHPEDAPQVRREWSAIFENDQYAQEYRFQKQDGSFIWIHNESRLVRDLAGNPIEVVGYCIDITERKNAEGAIRQLNQDLEQRARELKASNQELEAFSYSVSHDLRAPLRAIDGFSRILLNRYAADLPAEAQRYLNLVRENTREMGQLISDLLAFSRSSRQPLNKQRVEPESLVRLALRDLLKENDGRKVNIRIAPLPPCQADPSLLKQVFVNLLSNALKFSSARSEPRIEVGCLEQAGENIYYVRDNGVGFDMQAAGKLFAVFQRLHNPEDFDGTGVGLAIVQRVIQRHGGRVWAEAQVDLGASFYFTLPAAPAAADQPANAVRPADDVQPTDGSSALVSDQDDA